MPRPEAGCGGTSESQCEGTFQQVKSVTTNGEERGPIASPADLPRPLERPEFVFTTAFIPIASFSWVGILLAELGIFSGWHVLAGGAIVSAAAWSASAHEYRGAVAGLSPVPRRSWFGLALILAVAAGLFARPGEFLIEGADASVYLAIGRNIERTGGLVWADPSINLVPTELHESFFQADLRDASPMSRLPGGLRMAPDGRVAPSFFHLQPVWIAIATAAAGALGGYFVNVIFALLGIVLVWLIGRRLWSPVAGFVAAGLLAVNFGQIYNARLPSSEMLTQFTLLSSIFFTVLAWDQRSRVAGACGGAAVGLTAFTRIDGLLVMVPLAIAWLALTRRRGSLGPAWSWYSAGLAIVAGHAMVHAETGAALYVQGLFASQRFIASVSALLPGAQRIWDTVPTLAVTVAIAVAILSVAKLPGRWLVWAGIGGTLALALRSPDVIATFSLLISPIGLPVVLVGLAVLLTQRLDARVLAVIMPFVAEATLLLLWREPTTLPDGFRRYIPVVLPVSMLLVGFLVSNVTQGRAWATRMVWLVPLGMGALFLTQAAPILRAAPMRGVHAQVAEIARLIPPNAVVVTDTSVPGHLALAINYSFGRQTLRLEARPSGTVGIGPLIARAHAAGRPVFLAVAPFIEDRAEGLWRSDFADFDIREEAVVPLHYAVLASVRGIFPRELRIDQAPIALYRVDAQDRDTDVKLPWVVNVGEEDFQSVIQGFHLPEAFQSARARWTTGESRLALPRIARASAASAVLVLRLSAHRPPGMAPAVVRLAIGGSSAGVITGMTSDLREYRVPLPAPVLVRMLAGPTILTISTNAFVPRTVGMNDDGRLLGVLLDWVRIE